MRGARPTWLLLAYMAVLFVMLLAPLDFYTRNGAMWVRDADGITFASTGIVRTGSPPNRLYADLTSGQGLTVEAWLSTGAERQTGPARIVSYSASTSARNFTLGQQGRALIVRLRTPRTDHNGIPQLEVPDTFVSGTRQHVVVTFDLRRLCAYVDGRRRECSESFGGDFRAWDRSHELMLGNEATGNRPWLGAIFLAALYNTALSAESIERAHADGRQRNGPFTPASVEGLVALYRFTERSGKTVADSGARPPVPLEIPTVVEQLRPFLSTHSELRSWPPTPYAIIDAIVNLLLFLPFGVLGCAALAARGWSPAATITLTIAATAFFSLGVESLQYLVRSRSSELQDLVLNTLSGTIGAGLYWTAGIRGRPASSRLK